MSQCKLSDLRFVNNLLKSLKLSGVNNIWPTVATTDWILQKSFNSSLLLLLLLQLLITVTCNVCFTTFSSPLTTCPAQLFVWSENSACLENLLKSSEIQQSICSCSLLAFSLGYTEYYNIWMINIVYETFISTFCYDKLTQRSIINLILKTIE